MRKVDFNNVIESTKAEGKRLGAGNYVCKITDIEDFEAKEYVRILVDITEGEFAGHFSDDYFESRPSRHAVYLSYKQTAEGMLKKRLSTITECNPGFDAMSAFNGAAENPTVLAMFLGKYVGVCMDEEEYESLDGETRTGIKMGNLVTVSSIHDGTALPPRHKKLDGTWVSLEEAAKAKAAAEAAKAAKAVSDDEIPF